MSRVAFRSVLGLLSLAFSACGDDVTGPGPAQLDELCGEPGPVKILGIDGDRVLEAVSGREFGDRLLLMLRYADSGGRELWSVGDCGEEPALVSDTIDAWPVAFDPARPDALFYCDEVTGVVSVLDPTGSQQPSPVFETRECFVGGFTSRGLVSVLGDGDTGPLVLQPWPDDPFTQVAEQIVLHEEVRARALPEPRVWPNEHQVFAARGTEVFALTASDELVNVGLDDLEVTVLASHVREFEVSSTDGLARWIVWQDLEVTNDDPGQPQGRIYVLDRESGQAALLDETAMAYTSGSHMTAVAAGLLYYRVGGISDESAARWVRLETLEPYEVPLAVRPTGTIDESRVLLSSVYHGPPIIVLDVSTGEFTTLYSDSAALTTSIGDGLVILREAGGELIHVDFEGAKRTLGQSVEVGFRMSNSGHVVTPFAVNSDGIGSLTIIYPQDLDTHYVDDDVLAASVSIFEGENDSLLVSYAVVADDPERRGVWLSKPAP